MLTEQCIESIVANTMPNDQYEIILVDDCSTDGTFELCQEYERNNSGFIRTFRLSCNSRTASAPRNKGIDEAKGEYILFVDSDDSIIPETLDEIYNYVEKSNLNLFYVRNLGRLKNIADEKLPFSKRNIMYTGSANNLYKTEIIRENGIKFVAKLHYKEDMLFNYEYIIKAKNLRGSFNKDKDYYKDCLEQNENDAGRHVYNFQEQLILFATSFVRQIFGTISENPELFFLANSAFSEINNRFLNPINAKKDYDNPKLYMSIGKAFNDYVSTQFDIVFDSKNQEIVTELRNNTYSQFKLNRTASINAKHKKSIEKIVFPVTLYEIYEKYGLIYNDIDENRIEIHGNITEGAIASMKKISICLGRGKQNKVIFKNIDFLKPVSDKVKIYATFASTIEIGRFRIVEDVNIVARDRTHIVIGDDCMFSADIDIFAINAHSIYDYNGKMLPKREVTIGNHVWIGHGAKILAGSNIGNGSVIGSFSVCAGEIPNNCTAAGNPCKIIRRDIFWSEKMDPDIDNYFDLDEKMRTVNLEYIKKTRE